ncbi:hypothetical protein ABPG72_020094 [Tetrahymena utriculariae]
MTQQEIAIINPDNKQILEQTIIKFKKFLVEDLKIEDDKLNTNEGLQEKLSMVNNFKSYIQLIGNTSVANYISNVIINHFNLSEVTKQQKQKLSNFIEVFIEISMSSE